MKSEIAIQRSQAYAFFTDVFLYPDESWLEDLPVVKDILGELDVDQVELEILPMTTEELQSAYRKTFGATGSLCYETEYGLPHVYMQSQEMADLSGFYRAFGFETGGSVRERPDHIAVELEFMHVMALKEAVAINNGHEEQAEICREAQKNFLKDHIGKWIDLLAKTLTKQGDGPYAKIGLAAAALINADAKRMGVESEPLLLKNLQPTPFDPDFSCEDCAVAQIQNNPLGGPV